MPSNTENTNIALFCDFENIALGVRDAKYNSFDINKVLERFLLKGSIVVKKSYCDWDRYKDFKKTTWSTIIKSSNEIRFFIY